MKSPRLWQSFTDWYTKLSFRHPFLILGIFLLLTVAGVFISKGHIKIVTNLAALLPEGTPSVLALDESKKRIGSTDFFTIAIKSETNSAHAIAKMQDLLKERIEKEWDDADWVQVGRDTSFFHSHALYYLPVNELLDLRDTLQMELVKASAKKGFTVNLMGDDDDDDDDDGIDKWYDEELPRRLGLPPQVQKEFNSFFAAREKKEGDTDGLPRELSHRLIGPKGDVGVIFVQLAKPSTDLEYAEKVLLRGEKLIAEINPKSIDPSLIAQVVGAYRSFMEVDAVSKDGTVATSISLVLILFMMFIFFRSFRTIVVVVVPLLTAAAVTMAVTAGVYGRLTVLTVFILALLAGMGIDYGIHLFGRVIQDFRGGRSVEDSVHQSLLHTGRALFAAAGTTIASFLTLQAGHFQGFKEFGIVASYGLFIAVLASFLGIPPLVAMMERIRPLTRSEKELKQSEKDPDKFLGTSARKLAFYGFVISAVVTVGLSVFMPRAMFEYDFRNLRAPSTGATIGYGRAIGKDASSTPAVMLAKDMKQVEAAHEFLRNKLSVEKDPMLKSFITYYTFVPQAKKQETRQMVIGEIGDIVKKEAMRKLTGEKKRMIDELLLMVDAKPFTEKDLPDWALKVVTERDGTVGRVGHMYGHVEKWNANSVRDYQDRFGYLFFKNDGTVSHGTDEEAKLSLQGKDTGKGTWLPIASSNFILSDVVKMVQEDGEILAVFVSLVLLVILLLYSRSVVGMMLLMAVTGSIVIWTVGIMGLFDIRIGLYNLITIPVILGVGIDGAIHMFHRYLELGPQQLGKAMRTTGLSITASSFTTIAGFFGLIFVAHKGLRTIGVLASIGILLAWMASVVLLPWLMARFVKTENTTKSETEVEKENA